jgi:hypothetical protein
MKGMSSSMNFMAGGRDGGGRRKRRRGLDGFKERRLRRLRAVGGIV